MITTIKRYMSILRGKCSPAVRRLATTLKRYMPIWVWVASAIFIILMLPIFYKPIASFLLLDEAFPNSPRWEYIRHVGYLFGLILLVWQVNIANRRADALEKNAITNLKATAEQRYHNAVEHLGSKDSTVRIGAIYNLYHISQFTNEYDQTIFDMFCEYLRNDSDTKEKDKTTLREKQLIVDKLFREKESERVPFDHPPIDLSDTNLVGINFSHANLRKVLLKGAKLDKCLFEEADLTEAELPANLEGIITMRGVILDGVQLYSGTNMRGLQMGPSSDGRKSSLKNTILRYVDLSDAMLQDADFTGADLTGSKLTKWLTFEQLIRVKSLHATSGLDKQVEERLNEAKPKLFKQIGDANGNSKHSR